MNRLYEDEIASVFRLNGKLFVCLLIVAFCVLSASCGKNSSLKWKEDVLLPDGRTVTLLRYQEFKWRSEPFTPRGPSYNWFEFKNPKNGKLIRWENRGDLGTVALFFMDDVLYLLVMPRYVSSFRDLNCPNPPYLLRKYDSGSWKDVKLSTLSVLSEKRLRSNLSYDVGSDLRRAIDLYDAHLSTQYTQSLEYDYKPWIMDLSNVSEQTFGFENCARKTNDLIIQDAKNFGGKHEH